MLFWITASFSASKGISRLLSKPEFHHHIQRSLPPVLIPSQVQPSKITSPGIALQELDVDKTRYRSTITSVNHLKINFLQEDTNCCRQHNDFICITTRSVRISVRGGSSILAVGTDPDMK